MSEPAPGSGLRADLLAAGLLVATGVDGLYGRSATFEQVVGGLADMVTRAAADLAPVRLHFPPVEPTQDFLASGYLRSFPDLTGAVSAFTGGDRDHARLLGVLEDGGDWTAGLSPAGVVLTPAVCHPLYPGLRGVLPPEGRTFEVAGWCFRHEPSLDPARMQAFRQHEVVVVGDPETARRHRDRWVDLALDLTRNGLGLATEAVVANDPFFGRLGKVLAASQQQEALKIELVVPVALDTPTAVVSSNCHEDHFGAAFGIELPDGSPAHSACVGFGLERLTLALFAAHGLAPQGWPADVRRTLRL